MKELEENITPANIGGMGATLLPTATQTGSGDVPAKSGDAEKEYKKKKKKMKKLLKFESYLAENRKDYKSLLEGTMSDVHQLANDSKDIESFAKNFFKQYGAKIKKTSDSEEWVKSLYSEMNESAVNEAKPAGLSKKETLKVAQKFADALTKLDGKKFTVNSDYEEDSFDLDVDGEEYEGGSYNINVDGSVVNMAVRHPKTKVSPTYGNIDDDIKTIIKNIKNLKESVVNEAAQKSRGLEQFAADEKDEGNNAEIHLATFDGSGMEAQSTNKTWDDGVPVTKNFTRGGYKRISPKGEIYIIESDNWWYFFDKGMWYAVKRKDYGTPPFEY